MVPLDPSPPFFAYLLAKLGVIDEADDGPGDLLPLFREHERRRLRVGCIERERANPTLSVTYRIARAFGLSLQDLIESADSASSIQITRADDRAQVFRSDKQCQIRTLSPLNLEKDIEFYEVKLPVNGALRSQPHVDGTREFLTVEEGAVSLQSGNFSESLNTGDSATYRADVAHTIVNSGKREAALFLVVIYR